jgi:hypothetical protein
MIFNLKSKRRGEVKKEKQEWLEGREKVLGVMGKANTVKREC